MNAAEVAALVREVSWVSERGAKELERQAARADHFTDEWSDVCNENQVLINAIVAALAELSIVRDIMQVMAARAILEAALRR